MRRASPIGRSTPPQSAAPFANERVIAGIAPQRQHEAVAALLDDGDRQERLGRDLDRLAIETHVIAVHQRGEQAPQQRSVQRSGAAQHERLLGTHVEAAHVHGVIGGACAAAIECGSGRSPSPWPSTRATSSVRSSALKR